MKKKLINNLYKTLDEFWAFVKSFRIFSSMITGLIVTHLFYLDGKYPNFGIYCLNFLVLFLVSAFGFLFNDLIDVKKDRVGHQNRPLPSGRISIKKFSTWTSILLFFAIIIAAYIDSFLFLYCILLSALLILYSLVNNKWGGIANILCAFIVSLYFSIGIFNEKFNPYMIIMTISVFLFIWSREILLDIRDQKSDMHFGKVSIPIKRGVKNAIKISTFIGILSMLGMLIGSIWGDISIFSKIINFIIILTLTPYLLILNKTVTKLMLHRYFLLGRISFLLMVASMFLINI
jgi:geranylgeranylglycerol-phosphate geranylgeranyltransferase